MGFKFDPSGNVCTVRVMHTHKIEVRGYAEDFRQIKHSNGFGTTFGRIPIFVVTFVGIIATAVQNPLESLICKHSSHSFAECFFCA